MNKTLITFASEGYERSAEALMRSAAPYFDHMKIYTPADIKDFMAEHPAHFENSKGMGFWVWKPYIILDALKQTHSGDAVMYTDACLEFVRSPEELFEGMGHPKIFTSGQNHFNYCKEYTFFKMGIQGYKYDDIEQANGAFQIYFNRFSSRLLLAHYLKRCTDLKLINDETEVEAPTFIAHRHDQAILTNLCIKHGISIRRDIVSQYGTSNPIINHHRRRL